MKGPLLTIDTTGATTLVGLFGADGQGLAQAAQAATFENNAASHLPGLVQAAMKRAGLDMAAIQQIAVNRGPGSFTGIRVGLAFATGLHFGLSTPLLGLTFFELARHHFAPDRLAYPLTILRDTKCGSSYAAHYAHATAAPIYAVIPHREITAALAGAAMVIVEGNYLMQALESAEIDGPVLSYVPAPLDLGHAVQMLMGAHDFAAATYPPLPLYIKMPNITAPRSARIRESTP